MFPFFYDPTMIIIIPFILFSVYAQYKVKSTFNKYLSVTARTNKSGADIARELLRKEGVSDVTVEQTQGRLSDHYDPRSKTLRLSSDVYRGSSLAAIGVAAHETGHAIQDATEYSPLKVRHSLFPVANFGSQLGPILAVVGFLFFKSQFLVGLGILFFLGAVLFQIITLPVEFNASNRALKLLQQYNFLNRDEAKGTKKVLNAAALTYVASTLVAIGHLLRLVMMFGMMDED
ncbi:putative Zn-dependent protease [Halobacteroides halobius DSM 5150]|uniref:Putative Zn-dependent protease n=1 Tax=Halobacteroides halobius (strain ATCC 35273 / DSM 5150 / MD-1) TaxID=748449 RepID=L0K8I8_HALHC|nr:zinc metallopeptidase [Halobacteroides halobius]AGB40850.1 putative Zn-dependent protease [Halobacteroides halobius DSM 5150]